MPHAIEDEAPGGFAETAGENPSARQDAQPSHRRVVLCFDGTGNKFSGSESDTNVIKIFRMLDRSEAEQFHYYQPGIGTYKKDGSLSSSATFGGGIINTITAAIDQAVGTSFRDHVLAGYKFLMRYYRPGDQVYFFGFSRGSYTARFLSEMIHDLGLLSQGNEEMVAFAWETYSNYQKVDRDPTKRNPKQMAQLNYMKKFRKTFCRRAVRIHFLGLFDCVASVGQFEIPWYRSRPPYTASAPAIHIRHAVSIHESRVKFRPALFLTDPDFRDPRNETLKEIWFAGDHSDIGGGWTREHGEMGLLSDHALQWMIDEVRTLPNTPLPLTFSANLEPRIVFHLHKHHQKDMALTTASNPNLSSPTATSPSCPNPGDRIDPDKPDSVLGRAGWWFWWIVTPRFRPPETPHHSLMVGAGDSVPMTLFWWVIEILPLFRRLEYEHDKWVARRYPNLGNPRDIPEHAAFHASVEDYVRRGKIPRPRVGGDGVMSWRSLLGFANIRERVAFWRDAKRDEERADAEGGEEGQAVPTSTSWTGPPVEGVNGQGGTGNGVSETDPLLGGARPA